jgi:poly(3-hydroxybutyrate) depolymerase
MKSISVLLLFFGIGFLNSQTYNLQVLNGYGSGSYDAGDTVHIWSKETHNLKYFDRWVSSGIFIENENEYHTRIVMPSRDIQVAAITKDLPSRAFFTRVNIQLATSLKTVHYYFPLPNELKAVVWLFHGTNGTGAGWVNNVEQRQFANRLMAEGYAVVAMDCEEQTLKTDLNGDGVYRWTYGIDTNNLPDFLNIKALRDTLLTRGVITTETPMIAAGFSAGGAFTENILIALQWKAGINHNAAGSLNWASYNNRPYFNCMSVNDDHPDVGPTGNDTARMKAEIYKTRGICMEYYEFQPQPVYPERFAKIEGIDENESKAIFQELKSKNAFDNNNVMIVSANDVENAFAANPSSFPVLSTYFSATRDDIFDQLAVCNAEHNFKADYNGRALKFLENLCNTVDVDNDSNESVQPTPYPNPVTHVLQIPAEIKHYNIMDMMGRCLFSGEARSVEVSKWNSGVYVLVSGSRHVLFEKL